MNTPRQEPEGPARAPELGHHPRFELAVLMTGGAVVLGFLCLVSEPVADLLFGWIAFFKRTETPVTWNRAALGFGALVTTAAVGALHWLGRSWFSRVAGRPWQWRWTWSLLASLWLLFVVAIAVPGMARSANLLANYSEPWMRNSYQFAMINSRMRDVTLSIAVSLIDEKDDYEAVKSAVAYKARSEDFSTVWAPRPSRDGLIALVIPRHPRLLQQFGAVGVDGRGETKHYRAHELDAAISEIMKNRSSDGSSAPHGGLPSASPLKP